MKNAMKKLLSLVLVAMLLVSVVPMGAMAAEDETVKIGFVVNVNGKQAYPAEGMLPVEMTQAPGAMLSDLIDSMDAYGEFDSFAGTNGTFGDYEVAKNYAVVSGETYTLNFTQGENPTDPPATEKKPVIMTVKAEGKDDKTYTIELNGDSAPIGDLLYYHFSKNWKNDYNFDHAYRDGNEIYDYSTLAYPGDDISVRLTKKNSESKPTEPSVSPVHYVIKLNSSNNILAEGDKTPANGKYLVVKDLLNNWSSNWDGNYDFSHAQVKGSDKNIGLDGTVDAGKTVYIMLESKGGSTSEQYTVYFNDADNNVVYSAKVNKGDVIGSKIAEAARDEVKNDKKGYTFEGWRLNGAGNILSTNTIAHTTVKTSLSYYPVYSKDGSDSDKLNSNKVKLHIFLDNRVTNPAKDIDITDGIAEDGVVTLGEVKNVVKKYYSAKNDDGIIYDGLYFATGSWVGQFVKDEKVDRIDNINELKKDGYVHINVMVNNAKAKTNSNADSSNPKTGDDIYMTVTVMGLSAAALCAVYFVSKKRAVR